MIQRMKQRREFLAAARGHKQVRKSLVLQVNARSGHDHARQGYTVTKKVGNAVVRNRIKRRLRAAVALNAHALLPGHDYVFIGRREALTLPFSFISDDVKGAVASAHRALAKSGHPN